MCVPSRRVGENARAPLISLCPAIYIFLTYDVSVEPRHQQGSRVRSTPAPQPPHPSSNCATAVAIVYTFESKNVTKCVLVCTHLHACVCEGVWAKNGDQGRFSLSSRHDRTPTPKFTCGRLERLINFEENSPASNVRVFSTVWKLLQDQVLGNCQGSVF